MTSQTMEGPGHPLGVFSDYSNHGTEVTVTIREKEQNWLEVLDSDGHIHMSVVGRDNKFLLDDQGSPILNVRNKALNFGGEYRVFEGDADTMPLFTVRNKLSLGGARMAVKFTNFDEKPVKLQVRGKLLDSGGKIMLNDQPVARFESGVPQSMAGQPDKLEAVSKITVAPLVDVAMVATIFVCLHDISNKD